MQTTVSPFNQNARLLELACESGFYTYDFLRWGARSVVGVDISPIMIDEAGKSRIGFLHPGDPPSEKYLRGEGAGGASMEELESYNEVANYGLLVIGK